MTMIDTAGLSLGALFLLLFGHLPTPTVLIPFVMRRYPAWNVRAKDRSVSWIRVGLLALATFGSFFWPMLLFVVPGLTIPVEMIRPMFTGKGFGRFLMLWGFIGSVAMAALMMLGVLDSVV